MSQLFFKDGLMMDGCGVRRGSTPRISSEAFSTSTSSATAAKACYEVPAPDTWLLLSSNCLMPRSRLDHKRQFKPYDKRFLPLLPPFTLRTKLHIKVPYQSSKYTSHLCPCEILTYAIPRAHRERLKHCAPVTGILLITQPSSGRESVRVFKIGPRVEGWVHRDADTCVWGDVCTGDGSTLSGCHARQVDW